MTADISPSQCRQARALLGWSRDRLAPLANISVISIRRFERQEKPGTDFTLATSRATFEAAGIIFSDEGHKRPLVQLRNSGGASVVTAVITLDQYHNTRALLGWTRSRLAANAGISVSTAAAFESRERKLNARTLAVLRRTFEFAGIEFTTENSCGTGVRLRKTQAID